MGGVVVFVRRVLLLILMLVIPLVLTALLYTATVQGLHMTNRIIDPQILRLSAAAEYAAFLLVMLLEVRGRW